MASVSLFSISFFLYLLALMLLVVEAYQLWTPIYYPIISWWEYDFRYRTDLKVKVIMDGDRLDGRLTDLRKGAGCIALFRKINVGDFFQVELDEGQVFKVEVMSKRYYSFGRPFSYGVRPVLSTKSEKESFKSLSMLWRDKKRLVIKEKFEPV